MTHGSLFTGIGGFDLAAREVGIENRWACEILPEAQTVLRHRFPDIQIFNDITELSGEDIPPVDIISFGSPCQDVSFAGLREGITGAKSGLFYQATRIIREMRRATYGLFPKYAVMENVTGIFVKDWGYCLEEFCRINDDSLRLPEPLQRKHAPAGEVLGTGWSVAWRTLCAYGFGVPQYRRRMYACLDFRGHNASDVLCEQYNERRAFTPHYVQTSGYIGSVQRETGGDRAVVAINDTCVSKAPERSTCALGIVENAQYLPTLTRTHHHMVAYTDSAGRFIIRRTTPVECERAQGFPDGWTESVGMTKRYQLLGNSIAVPCAVYVFNGIRKLNPLAFEKI